MATRERLLSNKIALLEAELANARAMLSQQPGATPTPGGDAVSGVAGAAALSTVPGVSTEDYERLKNELTEVYRRVGETSQHLVEKTTEIKRLSDLAQEKDREIAALQGKCADAEKAAATADDTIKDKETTVSILRAELRGLQVRLVKTENDLRVATDERDAVCCQPTLVFFFFCPHHPFTNTKLLSEHRWRSGG